MNAIKRLITLVLAIFIIVACTSPCFAADSIRQIDDFEGLPGDAKYLGEEYREFYYLDIEKTGMLESGDKILNQIANALFAIVSLLGYLVTAFFYFAMTFDIAGLFAPEIDTIQSALKSSIFDTFFVP